MALLKKEKEKREIKDDDSLFVKLWFNERSHAAIVLGLYFIFFALIIIFVKVTGTSKNVNKTVTGESILKVFESIDHKDISYNYVITDQNRTYYFSGENKDDSIRGTILHNGESVSVRIIDDNCTVGDYTDGEFVPAYSLCPENIDYKFFNYKSIYKMIKNLKGTNYETSGYYLFKLDSDTLVKVFYNSDKNLKGITIDGKSHYELNYDEKEVKTSDNNE